MAIRYVTSPPPPTKIRELCHGPLTIGDRVWKRAPPSPQTHKIILSQGLVINHIISIASLSDLSFREIALEQDPHVCWHCTCSSESSPHTLIWIVRSADLFEGRGTQPWLTFKCVVLHHSLVALRPPTVICICTQCISFIEARLIRPN